jgi:hypothetical protein
LPFRDNSIAGTNHQACKWSVFTLRHIASELSPDTKYPEKQLNEIIAKFHPDTAALRRHMIEYGILERDGESVYSVKV